MSNCNTVYKETPRNLKFLVDNFSGNLSDIEIVKLWFITNGEESDGIKLISELASSKISKLETEVGYHQWLSYPYPNLYKEYKAEVATLLDTVARRSMLNISNEAYRKELEELIPTVNMPKGPYWIDAINEINHMGIHFKNEKEIGWNGNGEPMNKDRDYKWYKEGRSNG